MLGMKQGKHHQQESETMTYEEAMESVTTTVSVPEAKAELWRHSWTWRDMQREDPAGEPSPDDDGRYSTRDILIWLGY